MIHIVTAVELVNYEEDMKTVVGAYSTVHLAYNAVFKYIAGDEENQYIDQYEIQTIGVDDEPYNSVFVVLDSRGQVKYETLNGRKV